MFISHFFKSIENLLILTIVQMLAHLSHILLETEHHQTRMIRYLVLTTVGQDLQIRQGPSNWTSGGESQKLSQRRRRCCHRRRRRRRCQRR